MLALFKIPKHCNKQQFIPKNYLWWHFFCALSLSLSLTVLFLLPLPVAVVLSCLFHNILTSDQFILPKHNIPVSFEPFATLFCILILGIFYDAKCRRIQHTHKKHTQQQKKSWKLWNNGANFERNNYSDSDDDYNDDDHDDDGDDDDDDDTENNIQKYNNANGHEKSEWKHVDRYILLNRTRVKE